MHEGVLETFPRRGTFVQAAWRLRTLQQNLVLFRPRLEWLDELWQLARREVPEVWISDKFAEGIFELRTTQYVQAYHNQYADLSRIFESCFPDKSDFFLGPFEAFRINSRLNRPVRFPDGTLRTALLLGARIATGSRFDPAAIRNAHPGRIRFYRMR